MICARLFPMSGYWEQVRRSDPRARALADRHYSVRWRCSIFRNEGSRRSSEMIREATSLTFAFWDRHYSGRPKVPLTTEVDPSKVRRKRDPGRCFLRAGWRTVDERRGLIVLEAPEST
jgi:hypothetical protein